jgi:hypothetical protein
MTTLGDAKLLLRRAIEFVQCRETDADLQTACQGLIETASGAVQRELRIPGGRSTIFNFSDGMALGPKSIEHLSRLKAWLDTDTTEA